MKFKESIPFVGRAEIIVRGPDGRYKARRVARNVVVGAGVNAIMQIAAPIYLASGFTYLCVGNGTGGSSASNGTQPSPANTDTGLACGASGRVASTSLIPTYGYSNPTATLSYSYTWAAGVLTTNGPIPYGAVECGLFTAASSGTMWNHLAFTVVSVAAADTLTINLTVQAT